MQEPRSIPKNQEEILELFMDEYVPELLTSDVVERGDRCGAQEPCGPAMLLRSEQCCGILEVRLPLQEHIENDVCVEVHPLLSRLAIFNQKRVTRKSRNPLILLGCGARI